MSTEGTDIIEGMSMSKTDGQCTVCSDGSCIACLASPDAIAAHMARSSDLSMEELRGSSDTRRRHIINTAIESLADLVLNPKQRRTKAIVLRNSVNYVRAVLQSIASLQQQYRNAVSSFAELNAIHGDLLSQAEEAKRENEELRQLLAHATLVRQQRQQAAATNNHATKSFSYTLPVQSSPVASNISPRTPDPALVTSPATTTTTDIFGNAIPSLDAQALASMQQNVRPRAGWSSVPSSPRVANTSPRVAVVQPTLTQLSNKRRMSLDSLAPMTIEGSSKKRKRKRIDEDMYDSLATLTPQLGQFSFANSPPPTMGSPSAIKEDQLMQYFLVTECSNFA